MRWANFKQPARFRQLWSPIGAIVVTALGYYLYIKDYHELLRPKVEEVLGNFQVIIDWTELLITFLYSLLILIIFIIIKTNVNYGFLGARKYKTNQWTALKDAGLGQAPNFVYQLYDGKYIALKRLWEFAPPFFYYASIVGGVGLVATILALDKISFFPPLTVFPILVLLEFYWFFNGEKAKPSEQEKEEIDIPGIKNRVFYYHLWEEYQKEWSENVLAAWHYQGREEFENADLETKPSGSFMGLLPKLNNRQQRIYQHLSEGLDLIVSNVRYNEVTPVLFTFLLQKVLNGERILVVTPRLCFNHSSHHQAVLQWLNEGLKKLSGNDIFWSSSIYDYQSRGQLDKDVIVSSADDLIEHKALKYEWFKNLHTIVFIDTIETFAINPTSNTILLKALKDRNATIQTITLTNYRRGIQDMVKRNFEISKQFEEVRLLPNEAQETFLLFWKLEEIPFQRRVMMGKIDSWLGAEVPLSLLGWREGLQNIELVGQEGLPYYEFLEQLDNNKNRLDNLFIPPAQLNGNARQNIRVVERELFNQRHENAFLLARDTIYNIPAVLEEWNAYGEQVTFLQIISPPYLLREYFTDNLKYFKKAPLYGLSAYLMNTSRFSVALALLERMIAEPLNEQQIRFELAKIELHQGTISDLLRDLFLLAFKIDLNKSAWLNIEEKWEYSQSKNNYDAVRYYALSEKIKEQVELRFLKYIKVVDQHNNNVQRILPYDLLYQNYLPGQLHVFQQGRAYQIEQLDLQNYWLRTDNQEPQSRIIAYRADREVVLKKLLPPFHSDIDETQEGVQLSLREGTFEVSTKGYFSLYNGLKLGKNNIDYSYTNLTNRAIPKRKYPLGRILEIEIQYDLIHLNKTKVSTTLCVLLQELFFTLFPETQQYLIVTSPDAHFPEKFSQLYTPLKVELKKLFFETPKKKSQTIQLYIFEDAHQDLGLANSIFKEWKYIFEILGDYLHWLDHQPMEQKEEEAARPLVQGDFRQKSFNGRSFLKFGLAEISSSGKENNKGEKLYSSLKHFPEWLDLENTAYLIDYIVGENELTIERGQKRTPKQKRKKRELSPTGRHQCDFCAKEYPAMEMKVLEDGRERCMICNETAIDSEAALQIVLKEAYDWFKSRGRFKELSKDVKMVFVSSEKIQQYRGDNFRPSPRFDPRTLGLAVRKGNKYSVWIEKGQPYHHTLAIMVHELTHIWQYGNVNYAQMKKEWGLHLIEGHTIWAEIDVLQQKFRKDQNAAYLEFIDREKNRTDLYGEGYRLLLQFMQDNQIDDAFVYLKNVYPKNG